MNQYKNQYKLVDHHESVNFERLVESFIKHGYSPLGGAFFANGSFYQAMLFKSTPDFKVIYHDE